MAWLSCKALNNLEGLVEVVEVNHVYGQEPVVGGMTTGEQKVVMRIGTFVVPAWQKGGSISYKYSHNSEDIDKVVEENLIPHEELVVGGMSTQVPKVMVGIGTSLVHEWEKVLP